MRSKDGTATRAVRRTGSAAVAAAAILLGGSCGGQRPTLSPTAAATAGTAPGAAAGARTAGERRGFAVLERSVRGRVTKSSCSSRGANGFLCHALVRLRNGTCNLYDVDEHGFVLQGLGVSCRKSPA